MCVSHGLNEELGRHRGRKIVCCVGMSVRVLVIHFGIVQQIVVHVLLKLQASLGGSYARSEAMSSLDEALFVLGNEL